MGFRKWLIKNASKTAETVIEQTKDVMQAKALKKVATKSHVYVTLSRIGILGLLLLLSRNEKPDSAPVQTDSIASSPNIVINNYIRESKKEDRND